MRITSIGGGNKEPMIRDAAEHARNSNVLIVPTACSTPTSYDRKVAACQDFFDTLGLPNTVLHTLGETPTPTKLAHEFGSAGMAYILGGHTPTMLELMVQHGTDTAIGTELSLGLTMSGTSAGALAPFSHIHSCPAKKPEQEIWDYVQLDGLSILRAAATAHANQHDKTPSGLRPDSRLDHLIAHFPAEAPIGFGIENGAALVLRDDHISVLTSRPDAQVHVLQPSAEGVQLYSAGHAEDLTAVVSDILGKPLRMHNAAH